YPRIAKLLLRCCQLRLGRRQLRLRRLARGTRCLEIPLGERTRGHERGGALELPCRVGGVDACTGHGRTCGLHLNADGCVVYACQQRSGPYGLAFFSMDAEYRPAELRTDRCLTRGCERAR